MVARISIMDIRQDPVVLPPSSVLQVADEIILSHTRSLAGEVGGEGEGCLPALWRECGLVAAVGGIPPVLIGFKEADFLYSCLSLYSCLYSCGH
jgi:hypothetical protein